MTKETFISRGDLKFWIPIIGLIVASAITFTTLGGTVNAMQDKGEKLREEMEAEIERSVTKDENILEVVIEIRETQIKMQKDIEFIKNRL